MNCWIWFFLWKHFAANESDNHQLVQGQVSGGKTDQLSFQDFLTLFLMVATLHCHGEEQCFFTLLISTGYSSTQIIIMHTHAHIVAAATAEPINMQLVFHCILKINIIILLMIPPHTQHYLLWSSAFGRGSVVYIHSYQSIAICIENCHMEPISHHLFYI